MGTQVIGSVNLEDDTVEFILSVEIVGKNDIVVHTYDHMFNCPILYTWSDSTNNNTWEDVVYAIKHGYNYANSEAGILIEDGMITLHAISTFVLGTTQSKYQLPANLCLSAFQVFAANAYTFTHEDFQKAKRLQLQEGSEYLNELMSQMSVKPTDCVAPMDINLAH